MYAAGNPLRYTDPSGEIIPFLVAAGLGGLISGGIDLGTQLLAMHPQSLSQALRCVNWGEVGIAFAGGAVAGLTGFTIFGATTALLGSGFFANLAAGTISGVVAGQYARLTGLVLSGKTDQISSTMFRLKDLLVDSILGAFGGAINYGLQRGFSGIAEDILQRVTNSANQRLAANPGLAQNVLRPREYAAGQANPAVARMEYGNAVERMVAQQVGENPLLSRLFEHIGGPYNPDFIGRGIFNGLNYVHYQNWPPGTGDAA